VEVNDTKALSHVSLADLVACLIVALGLVTESLHQHGRLEHQTPAPQDLLGSEAHDVLGLQGDCARSPHVVLDPHEGELTLRWFIAVAAMFLLYEVHVVDKISDVAPAP